jgi:hypothetical protein
VSTNPLPACWKKCVKIPGAATSDCSKMPFVAVLSSGIAANGSALT